MDRTGTGDGEKDIRSYSSRGWLFPTLLGLSMTGIGIYYGINAPEKHPALDQYEWIEKKLDDFPQIPLRDFSKENLTVLQESYLEITSRANKLTRERNKIISEHPNIESIREKYNRETNGIIESSWISLTGWGVLISFCGLFNFSKRTLTTRVQKNRNKRKGHYM